MMPNPNNKKLFNSKTDPIPAVRRDLQVIPVEDNGQSYLLFHDSLGYATPNFALDSSAGVILNLLDGRKSVQDLSPYLGEGVTIRQLLNYIQFLDENRILHSSYFQQHSEAIEQQYEESEIHYSATAGISYPAKPDALRQYLDKAFANIQTELKVKPVKGSENIKALYAPHIDPRVGLKSYAEAFSAIKDLRPKRVVILATSHYAGLYPDLYSEKPFILSSKDFEMPLGTINTDKEAVRELLGKHEENGTDAGITHHDRAHRLEHSIELHLLFLNYLWNHNYQIIPILVSSLEELLYMKEGHRGQQVENFSKLVYEKFGQDDDTFFLISGDLAHVGKKFGDMKPAKDMFEEVKEFDAHFLENAKHSQESKLLEQVAESYDPYRICGFPPLYTFLKSMPGLKGEVINYDIWDEKERESAVSFGSVLYSEE